MSVGAQFLADTTSLQVREPPRMAAHGPIYRGRARCRAVEQPLMSFARLLRQQLRVCDELERAAEALPSEFDPQVCAELVAGVPEILPLIQEVSECVIYPALLNEAAHHRFTQETAARLCDDHLVDQIYACKVCEFLSDLAENNAAGDRDRAARLLRGFVESARRTMAFELTYVVPLARKHLTRNDMYQVAAILHEHQFVRSGSCSTTLLSIHNQTLH